MTTDSDWHGFLASISSEIAARQSRLKSLIGDAHRGEEGVYKEVLVRQMLLKHLPARFAVSTGFVYWSASTISKQLDIIIWDQQETAPLMREGDFVVLPPEGVAAVIEVKGTLTRAALRSSLELLHPIPWRTYRNSSGRPPVRVVVAFRNDLGKRAPIKACMEELVAFYEDRFAGNPLGVLAIRERIQSVATGQIDGRFRAAEMANPRFYNLIDAVCVMDCFLVEQHAFQSVSWRDREQEELGYREPGLKSSVNGPDGQPLAFARLLMLIRDLMNRRLGGPHHHPEYLRRVSTLPPGEPEFCVFSGASSPAGQKARQHGKTTWSPDKPWEMPREQQGVFMDYPPPGRFGQ